MRTGILAKKLGGSSWFNEKGEKLQITILQIENCEVVANKTKDIHGYNAVVLGVGEIKDKKLSKPMKGFFEKNNIEPKRLLKEFRVSEDAMLNVGHKITVQHFAVGQYVDVSGITIGKGFAGGMKRHNFRGLEASHGVSVSHRSIGSTGGRQDPGKTFKNKKMPGHMGCSRVTMQNIKVLMIDLENNLIIVKGSIPGSENSIVEIKDSVKKALTSNVPYPAFNVDAA